MFQYSMIKIQCFVRILIGIVSFSILFCVFLLGDSIAVRYKRLPSHRDIIYRQTGPVDLVFFGGSRTWRGIIAQDLEGLLNERIGRKPVIYNLAFSDKGLDARYIMAKDLLEQRQVSTLIVEFTQRFAQGSSSSYPQFFRIANFYDIITGEFGDENLLYSVQTKLTMLQQKYSEVVVYIGNVVLGRNQWIGGFGKFKPKRKTTPALTSDKLRPNGIVSRLLVRRKLKEKYNNSYTHLELDDTRYIATNHYIKKFVELGRKHKINVVFLYMPAIYEPEVEEESKTAFKNYFGEELITAPKDLLNQLNPKGYADTNHFNEMGASRFQSFLADILVVHNLVQIPH